MTARRRRVTAFPLTLHRVACVIGLTAAMAGCRASRPPTRGPMPSAPPPPANTATTAPAAFESARRSFYDAVDGRRGALEACARELDGVWRTDWGRGNPRVAVYRGACRLLESAAAPMPWDKGRLARQGLDLMDGAVRAAPDDLEVRLVRGLTCAHLPRFFNRRAVAAGDLQRVAGGAAEAVRSGELDPDLAAAGLYHFGELRREAGDAAAARDAWRRAAELAPDSPAGRAAAERIGAE